MSVVDQFKKLFAKSDASSEHDSRLSLAMPDAVPDGTMGMLVTEQVQAHLDTDEVKPTRLICRFSARRPLASTSAPC